MNKKQVRQILKDTDFIHTSGSPEELKVAEYLKTRCEERGVKAWLESFPVEMAEVRHAKLTVKDAAGREQEIPCEGYRLCGSGSIEAPFIYLPNTDPASLSQIRGKIVLLDGGVGIFTYQDLLKGGAAGIITYDGNVHYADRDIDKKELRPYVAQGKKTLAVNVNAKDAVAVVKAGAVSAKIEVEQEESAGESHNVIAELPGESDEWIVLSAHLDTTPLSRGSYDNMTGCLGLLCVLDALKGKKHRYGLRFVFCGSEERGLLGSKAYVAAHEAELEKIALNINLDMIGTYMGKFITCVSAEDALLGFIRYFASIRGWGLDGRVGVYSSDSTPFADKGVPALSFARIAGPAQATIHNRYDTPAVLSDEQILKDSAFIAAFTETMADAVKCPVKREIPEKVKGDLDNYLGRKRKEQP
ncbi:MAG: Zn-dependent exopeptidase M28 [Lachnospiraceae bacterium]|nr:Zn-dependent exopeptidase M28 [Lachnospiraceae bacterium]